MKKSFLLVFVFSLVIEAQTTFEPLYKDVYPFLSRLAQKGVIRFDDRIKPLSRKYIAEKLIEADSLKFNLTELEQEELEFYKKDFFLEINFDSLAASDAERMNFFDKDGGGRFRVFSYHDPLFKINADPILGFRAGSRDKEKLTHYWSGLYFYGYISDFIGFSFDYRDNHESGKTIDTSKVFTPETGIVNISKSLNTVDYSEIHTTISADWKWGKFTVGKDFLEWGYGEGGKLVLSNKAPSFPFIRLDIYPVPWLRFNYFHGWLSSGVVDSTNIYPTLVPGENRFTFRSKYIASHTLSITPLQGLDISLGESVVYSDRLELAYLMPLMFFKLAEHYLSNYKNDAGDNSQFFVGISSRNHIKNTHLYGSLLIDEISLENLFNSQKQRNQIGFTIGASTTDMPVNNLTMTLEYTKIYPFVYSHFIPTETYENDSYLMGHWMGNNADQVYSSVMYRFIRGLQLSVWWQYIRKGEEGTGEQQKNADIPQPPFLFGLRNNYSYFGVNAEYEIINNLTASFKFQTAKTESEITKGNFTSDRLNEFYFYLFYGM